MNREILYRGKRKDNGEWIIVTDKFAPYEKCSVCGYDKPCIAGENVPEIKKYCPNCGAKMEVKK